MIGNSDTILPKCLLIPIDDSEEALRPVRFARRLYPDPNHVNLILSALSARRAENSSKDMVSSRRHATEENLSEAAAHIATRRVRRAIIDAGFPEQNIHEHIQKREMSVAKHACVLAETRKVDAVLVSRSVSSNLEGFFRGDETSALLDHCRVSPVWLVSGNPDPSRAAVFINMEDASIRAVDHAAFMLEGTSTKLEIVHFSGRISSPITTHALDPAPLLRAGNQVKAIFARASDAAIKAGADPAHLGLQVLPTRRDVAAEVLEYCLSRRVGIAVLGHTTPEGFWGFIKGSVTRKVIGDSMNLSVWVVQ